MKKYFVFSCFDLLHNWTAGKINLPHEIPTLLYRSETEKAAILYNGTCQDEYIRQSNGTSSDMQDIMRRGIAFQTGDKNHVEIITIGRT